MDITSIVLSNINPKSHGVCADVSIVLDDAIRINRIKIKNGNDGMYITFPSSKVDNDIRYVNGKRKFTDLVHPVNQGVRDKIKDAILSEYNRILSLS